MNDNDIVTPMISMSPKRGTMITKRELSFILLRAGVTVPQEYLLDLLPHAQAILKNLDRLNATTVDSSEEPAVVFNPTAGPTL